MLDPKTTNFEDPLVSKIHPVQTSRLLPAYRILQEIRVSGRFPFISQIPKKRFPQFFCQPIKNFIKMKCKHAGNNTPGLGIEYEVHLPAYFALLLNTNSEVEDFKLQSNVQNFGNFDDLLVDIETKSGKNLYFAFQLKHKEKSNKKINRDTFIKSRGDWYLKKYCDKFKESNEKNENFRKYHLILYTNCIFDSNTTSKTVSEFNIKEIEPQDTDSSGKKFFYTSDTGNNLYKFQINEGTKNVNQDNFREFFSKLSLYTKQANFRGLGKRILDILQYKECYVTYIDFFRRWHRGDFIDKILDKKTLNVHLVDILLNPIAIDCHLSDGQDGNSIFFETIVQQFDITVIDDPNQKFIHHLEKNVHKYPEKFNKNSEEMIKLGKKNKLVDISTKKLNEETKLKLLHYFFQKPLILDFHESSKDLIYDASKLCKIQETEIKLVILGQNIDKSKFSHLKIFTKLSEVDGILLEQVKKKCNLSLQGRNISFEEIFEDEIREIVTPKEVFQMLKGNFSIGEDKENLPECYIPRTVSTTVFDIESIIKHSTGSTTIIFYYGDKFEELEILFKKIVDVQDYFCKYSLDEKLFSPREFSKPTIILMKKECSRKQLNDIRKETGKDDIRLFKVIDEKRCLLLMGTKDTSFKENYKSSKMTVEENRIHHVFNTSINILCTQSGMGKSWLMRCLQNKCDPSFWTIWVDLKAHNNFFKENASGNPDINKILNYFLQLDNCEDLFPLNIKKMFERKQRIVFFLDGLDEVENECVDCVLNIIRQLSVMGFRIWLSSRQNLQQKLEQYFNIFSIEVDELNKDQQKKYIKRKLSSKYNENEIEEIVKKIFKNTDLGNNYQILEIPLQLQIITQIFVDNYSNLSENDSILTKMFEIFEGKYKHFVTKFESRNPHLFKRLEEQLEKIYQIVALHSALDDEHFQKLQIEKLKLTEIKNSDFLGIITEVNNENKPVFENLAFAEYFASKFLVKNFDKTHILRKEIFAEKYRNIRIIFNILQAEDSSTNYF